MTPRHPGAPALDLSHLAVHALWFGWGAALLTFWDGLPLWGRVGMLAAGVVVHFWNYAVLHNHMHVPIAAPRPLQWLVSRSLGVACGYAYRGYSLHHFNHHRYNDGPGDWGQRHRGEGPVRYCLRSALTVWFWPFELVPQVWRAARTRAHKAELVLDFALVDGTLLALVLWRPALGLGYFGMLLVGQMLVLWLNVAAHHGADAGQRDALAVTSTSRLYNLLCFNAGHHQAHHLRPQLPWRQLPEATRALLAAGRLRPALQTPLAPLNPLWVTRVLQDYSSGPCDRQPASTITPKTPSAATS